MRIIGDEYLMKTILDLFLTFMKIGAFTFGGGYAMIPLIQREVCTNKKWLKDEDILDIIAIAESTPGPIAINAATFVGYRVAGFFGAFMATLGVVLPSFLIITAVSFVLKAFGDLKVVKYAFTGVRAAVLALLLKALWSLFKVSKKNAVSYALMAAAFVFAAFAKADAVLIILVCAVFGLIWTLLRRRAGNDIS